MVENSPIITHDTLPVVTGNELQLTRLFQNLIGNALLQVPETRGATQDPHFGSSAGNGMESSSLATTAWVSSRNTPPPFSECPAACMARRLRAPAWVCRSASASSSVWGKMWATGWPGKGAEFYFTLPAITSHAGAVLPFKQARASALR